MNVEEVLSSIVHDNKLPKEETINEIGSSGDTLLIAALKQQNEESIILLLTSKADPNKKNQQGKLPIQIFIENYKESQKYQTNILKLLLENQGDPNAEDIHGNCILQSKSNEFYKKENLIKEIMFHPKFNWNYINSKTGDSLMHISFEKIINEIVLTSKINKVFDIQNKNGETPLHQYCYSNRNINQIKLLLSNKVNVNIKTNSDETPLSLLLINILSIEDCISKVQLLLENSANINQMIPNLDDSNIKEPVFHRMIYLNSSELISLGLQYHGDIYLKDSNGNSILSKISNENEDIISLIQSHRNHSSISPNELCKSVENKSLDLIMSLNNYLKNDLNGYNIDGDTPLITAVKNNYLGIIKPLVKAKADINKKNINGETPLHIFFKNINHQNQIKHYQFEILVTLLNCKADTNIEDSNGNCILQFQSNSNEILEFKKEILYNSNFNWNFIHSITGDSILHFSFGFFINKSVIESNRFDNIDILNYNDETPLHQYCKSKKYPNMIKILIENKANVNLITKSGESPLSLVIQDVSDIDRCKKCLLILLESNVDIYQLVPIRNLKNFHFELENLGNEPVFHQIIKSENMDLIQLLFSKRKNIDLYKSDSNGLICMKKTNQTQILEFLNSFEPKVDQSRILKLTQMIINKETINFQNFTYAEINGIENNSGETPLTLSVKNNLLKYISPLIKSNANINKKNKKGETPCHVFFNQLLLHNNYDHQKLLTLLKILLRFQPDTNIEDSNGNCILQIQSNSNENFQKEILYNSNFNWDYKNSVSGDSILHFSFGSFINKLVIDSNYFNQMDVLNYNDETPLHQYCKSKKYPNMIKILIENKANVNLITKSGESPLSLVIQDFALIEDCEICLKILLKSNANINQLVPKKRKHLNNFLNDTGGSEPIFHQIIKTNKKNWISLCLNYSANPFTLLVKDSSNIHPVLKQTTKEIQNYLNNEIKIRLNQFNSLKKAIHENNRNQLIFLLSREQLNPNMLAPFTGNSCLHFSIKQNYFDLTEILILFNGDILLPNFKGISPIQYCILNDSFDSLSAILSFSHIPLYTVKDCLHMVCTSVNKNEIKLQMKKLLQNYLLQIDNNDAIIECNQSESHDEILDEFEFIASDSDFLVIPNEIEDWKTFNVSILGKNQNRWPNKSFLNWNFIIENPLRTGKSLAWIPDQFASKCYNCNSLFKKFTKRKVNYIIFN